MNSNNFNNGNGNNKYNYYDPYKIADEYKKHANQNVSQFDTNYRGYGTGIKNVDTTKMSGDQLGLYQTDLGVVDQYRKAAENMTKQKNDLGTQADNQKQQAYVQGEMTKKYLPQYQKATGTYGLGTSESAALNIANQYRSSVNGINNYQAKRQNQLDDGFNSYEAELNKQSDYATSDYNKIAEQYRQAATYNSFNSHLSKADTDLTKFKEEMDMFGYAMSPEQKALLSSNYANTRSDRTYSELTNAFSAGGSNIAHFKSELEKRKEHMNSTSYDRATRILQEMEWEENAEVAKKYLTENKHKFKKLDNDFYTYESYNDIKNYLDTYGKGISKDAYETLLNDYYLVSEKESEYNGRIGDAIKSDGTTWPTYTDTQGTSYQVDKNAIWGSNLNQPKGLAAYGVKGKIYTTTNGEKYVWEPERRDSTKGKYVKLKLK